jgi:Flp pilus assembly protein TadG
MRALKRLIGLLKNEKGNALIIGAATLPLILGSAAFAVDSIQMALMKRQLQHAADSAAMAGAYALEQSVDPEDAVHHDLDQNYFPILTQAESVIVGPSGGYQQTVRVQLTTAKKLPFFSLFTHTTTTITGDATAALVQTGKFCMLSLYGGTDPGIDVNGTADVTLLCGMAANSTGPQAVTAGGNSTITASPIMAVGGLDGTSNNFVAPTKLQPHSQAQADPFAGVPNPTVPSPCSPGGELSGSTVISGNGPFCFTSVSIKPSESVTLPSNSTIYVNGGDVDIKGDFTAMNSTLVMTGTNGQAGNFTMNSQANLRMSAPTSGTYQGLIIYRDRRASNVGIKINGGAGSQFSGAIYMPSTDMEFTGNSGMNVQCLQMVGQKLIFRGTAQLNNNCNVAGQTDGFKLTYVKLIA